MFIISKIDFFSSFLIILFYLMLNRSIPVRSILKNTRFAVTDETNDKKSDDFIFKIEERENLSPRKLITTVTEEYHRIQRKIIEEFDDGIDYFKSIF